MMEARLLKRKKEGLFRSLHSTIGLVDLTSNDYFGFAKLADEESSGGSTGSRLLTGNSPFYEELEERIAKFHRAESCLIYNSGYTANLGLLSALGTPDVMFLYDIEIHASMIDGMRLSEAKKRPFRHNDLDSLERNLKNGAAPRFVLIESIYSISGDLAPLREMACLCSRYGAKLIVDEAHATGVRGLKGEGLVAELGLEGEVFARIHTFSKALGAHGAAILGSRTLKEYLLNFSRPLIYTTALSSSTLVRVGWSYQKLEKEARQHQEQLHRLMGKLKAKSPVQPLYMENPRIVSQKLKKAGLDVRAIVPPTVAKGKECLRVVLHSFNREEEIDLLLEAVR